MPSNRLLALVIRRRQKAYRVTARHMAFEHRGGRSIFVLKNEIVLKSEYWNIGLISGYWN